MFLDLALTEMKPRFHLCAQPCTARVKFIQENRGLKNLPPVDRDCGNQPQLLTLTALQLNDERESLAAAFSRDRHFLTGRKLA